MGLINKVEVLKMKLYDTKTKLGFKEFIVTSPLRIKKTLGRVNKRSINLLNINNREVSKGEREGRLLVMNSSE